MEAIVVLWQRAVELRCASGPRLLPRAIVRGVQVVPGPEGSSFLIHTEGGTVQLDGLDLAPFAHRMQVWLRREGRRAFRPDEAVLGGGPGWLLESGARTNGTLMATPEGVVFMSSEDAQWWRFPWSALSASTGPRLDALEGQCMGGDGVSAVLAARSTARSSDRRLPRALSLTVRATTGWGRGRVWLSVGPGGLASRPLRAWSRVLGTGTPQHWDWNAIQSIRSTGATSGLSVVGPGAMRTWTGIGLRALAGELKRTRWRAARSVAPMRPDRSAGTWEAAVEARPETPGAVWSWGRLVIRDGQLTFTPAGADRPAFVQPLAGLEWRPQSSGASSSVGLWLPQGRWSVRPPDGAGFLRTFASLAGAPRPIETPSSSERRSGQRAMVDLPAWIDPWGRVPFVGPDRAVTVVEASVSGLVFRSHLPLKEGQEVGLALRAGGPVVATSATVVRELSPGTYAVRFLSPPASLVQRLGRLVRQLERDELEVRRDDHVPLTAGG